MSRRHAILLSFIEAEDPPNILLRHFVHGAVAASLNTTAEPPPSHVILIAASHGTPPPIYFRDTPPPLRPYRPSMPFHTVDIVFAEHGAINAASIAH